VGAGIAIDNGALAIALPTTVSLAAITDMRGRVLLSNRAARTWIIPAGILPQGSFILSCVQGSRHWAKMFAVN
jgi:hypothetical protein